MLNFKNLNKQVLKNSGGFLFALIPFPEVLDYFPSAFSYIKNNLRYGNNHNQK